MWKQSPPSAVPIGWLCVLAVFLWTGCANLTDGAEQELSAKRADSHLNLGLDYLGTDRVALALRELLLAESFDAKNPKIQQALADAYLMRGKSEEAERHYLRALEIAPTFHEARLNLSILYNQLNRYDESLIHTSMLAEDATFSAPWRALANKGLAEYRLGQLEEARHTLELGFEFRGDYWPTLLYLGMLEVEEGRRLEGLSLFRQVLENTTGREVQAQANYRIGEIYIALGKRKRAIGYLKAAVAQTPGGPWGAKSEAYLNLLR